MTRLLADVRLTDFIDPATRYGALIYAVIVFVTAYVLGRLVNISVKQFLEKDKHRLIDHATVAFLAQLAQIVIYVLAALTYAHLIPALQRLGTAWLTTAGVFSVVLGMAAQSTLSNLIAGFALLLYHPFRLGDRLQITAPTGLETGIVESLNLGYTVLRTADNRRVVVPNSQMASQTTVNLSLVADRTLFTLPIGISYTSDIDRARDILLDLAKKHPKVEEVTGCAVSDLGQSSVQLSLAMWCADAAPIPGLRSDLLESIKKRFDAEGIEIPYPYNNVILMQKPSDSQGNSALTHQIR